MRLIRESLRVLNNQPKRQIIKKKRKSEKSKEWLFFSKTVGVIENYH